MNEKMFEKSQEQATRWLETVTGLAMDNLRFAREEAERQVQQGKGILEFTQQTMLRQFEQAMTLGKSLAEMQDGMLKGAAQAFSVSRAA